MDYGYIINFNHAMKLLENTGINKNFIILIKGEQLFHGPDYILSLIQRKTLKTYIKINLNTGFI